MAELQRNSQDAAASAAESAVDQQVAKTEDASGAFDMPMDAEHGELQLSQGASSYDDDDDDEPFPEDETIPRGWLLKRTLSS